MECPVYSSENKGAVAQKAQEFKDAGYAIDMFEDRGPDGEDSRWVVIAFPIREVS